MMDVQRCCAFMPWCMTGRLSVSCVASIGPVNIQCSVTQMTQQARHCLCRHGGFCMQRGGSSG